MPSQFLELATVVSSTFYYDADYNIVRGLADSNVSITFHGSQFTPT